MKNRVIGILMISTVCLLGFLFSCSNPLTEIIMNNSRALVYTIPTDPEPIGGSDSPLTVTLLAGRTIDVGMVNVWIEDDKLYVQFESTWLLTETHLDVVTDPVNFPQTKKGNPKPGHFAYKMTHDPGITNYTYEILMSEFEETEVLYFAAHASVEEWVDGKLIHNESAWAESYDFPGANWATYFAGSMSEPVDVTGYWDFYYTPEGAPEMGPVMIMYLNQEDSRIEGSFGFFGTINGSNITLELVEPEFHVIMTGTVTENLISGTFTGGMGDGTFRLVSPCSISEYFGHLDLECTVDSAEGVKQLSLDTDFAIAWDQGSRMVYSVSCEMNTLLPNYTMFITTQSMSPGLYTVNPDGLNENDEISIMLEDWKGGMMYQPSSGTVFIEEYSNDRLIVRDFKLFFPDGNYLSGDLINMNFFESTGVITLFDNSIWQGDPLPTSTAGIYSDFNENPESGFWIRYNDHQLSVSLEIGINAIPGSGTYPIGEGSFVYILWETDEQEEEIWIDSTGTLTITEYGNSIVGSLATGPPNNLTGSFSAIFAPPEDY